MVALNFQTPDLAMQLNQGKCEYNGNCGSVTDMRWNGRLMFLLLNSDVLTVFNFKDFKLPIMFVFAFIAQWCKCDEILSRKSHPSVTHKSANEPNYLNVSIAFCLLHSDSIKQLPDILDGHCFFHQIWLQSVERCHSYRHGVLFHTCGWVAG